VVVKKVNVFFDGKEYVYMPFWGVLIEKESTKLHNAWQAVQDPFLLKQNKVIIESIPHVSGFIALYARLLTRLSKHSFQLAICVSKLVRPRYRNAYEATMVYRSLYPGEQQEKLCLPRMLFASSMSKCFKLDGTAFIGVFLPSVQMHAWVIENNMLADPFDNQWICYQPVAIII
jgi:hypothetical protein